MKLKVMLVDDEKNALTAYRRIIEPHYQVLLYTDPQEALEVAKKDLNIAIIVADYLMPIMNGIELINAVRKYNKNIAAILLTGADKEDIGDKGLKNHLVLNYLAKPCSSEKFLDALAMAKVKYLSNLES